MGKMRLVNDLGPLDFEKYRRHLSETLGVHALTRNVTAVRSMFRYAVESELVDRPPRYGPVFRNPTKQQVRKARARQDRERGLKMFTPEELKRIIELCDVTPSPELCYLNYPTMKACILLGINGAFLNIDCAELPTALVDLEKGVIDYSRPKTGIQRFVTLWPETVAALRSAMFEHRTPPVSKHAARIALTTKTGEPVCKEYVTESDDGELQNVSRDEFLSEDFRLILKHLGMHRKGRGFSALRPTFRTLADEMHDDNAARLVMGHEIPGMDGVYIQKIGIDRVRAVTDHVRQQLFT
jgi:integrase